MRRDGAPAGERVIVTAAQLLATSEPFAGDTAGCGYFATDIHYQHLAAAIARSIAETRGFVLVTGEPAPDGSLVERCLGGGKAGECRVSLIRCRPGMGFDALIQALGRQIWLRDDSDGGLWPVLSQLMQDSRKGVMRILVLQNADALDDRTFDELYRFTRIDEPHSLPVVLLASPSLAERLDAPTLQLLKPAIAAHLPLQQLEPEETAAFIRYQLRMAGRDEDALTPETVAAIAEAAQGDPAEINRLAREAAATFARSRAPANPPPDAISVDAEVVSAPRASEIVDAPLQEDAAPGAPGAAVQSSRPGESVAPAAPRSVAPRQRKRHPRPGVAWAGYLVLVAASAGALFYMLAAGRERAPARQPQAAESGPELARAETAIAAAQPPAPAAPQRSAVNEIPRPPEPPAIANEHPPATASTARKLAAVEPSAAPPLSVAPEPPAAPQPSAAPEASHAVAMMEPQPAPVAPRQAESPPARDIATLVRRGGELFAAGDIVSARHFFERAAEAGDAAAAVALGKSYDPLVLEQVRTRGVAGDPAKAAEWYRRAAASGSAEASALLARLLVKYPR